MSAQNLDKLIARRQRGLKIRENDAFFRSGRILTIESATTPSISYVFSDGSKKKQDRQEFLSRKLTRIGIKSGETPTNADIAAAILKSKAFKKRVKIDLISGLVKKSTGAEKAAISQMLIAVKDSQDG